MTADEVKPKCAEEGSGRDAIGRYRRPGDRRKRDRARERKGRRRTCRAGPGGQRHGADARGKELAPTSGPGASVREGRGARGKERRADRWGQDGIERKGRGEATGRGKRRWAEKLGWRPD